MTTQSRPRRQRLLHPRHGSPSAARWTSRLWPPSPSAQHQSAGATVIEAIPEKSILRQTAIPYVDVDGAADVAETEYTPWLQHEPDAGTGAAHRTPEVKPAPRAVLARPWRCLRDYQLSSPVHHRPARASTLELDSRPLAAIADDRRTPSLPRPVSLADGGASGSIFPRDASPGPTPPGWRCRS